MYLCCMKYVEQADGLIDYTLLEIGVCGSYERISSYDSHSATFIGYLSSYSFPRNSKQIMLAKYSKYNSIFITLVRKWWPPFGVISIFLALVTFS